MKAAFILAVAIGGATAIQAETPKMDRDISLASAMVSFGKEGLRIPASVKKGQSLISMRATYRRTGVLKTDIKLEKSGKTYIPAGAHGYYAGLYSKGKDGKGKWSGSPMWCFTAQSEKTNPAIKCVREAKPAGAAGWEAVPNPKTKYLPLFSPRVKRKAVSVPEVEEREVTIHPDLRMECKFLGWTKVAAKINCRLGGLSHLGPGLHFPHPKGEVGSVLFKTPHGWLRLTPDPADKKAALVEQIDKDPPVEQII